MLEKDKGVKGTKSENLRKLYKLPSPLRLILKQKKIAFEENTSTYSFSQHLDWEQAFHFKQFPIVSFILFLA